METKVCTKCSLVLPVTKFKMVKGKYRLSFCNTCRNKSKESMDGKRARFTNKRSNQILRMRLFLYLWHANHPYDTCLAIVNQTHPVRVSVPMIGEQCDDD